MRLLEAVHLLAASFFGNRAVKGAIQVALKGRTNIPFLEKVGKIKSLAWSPEKSMFVPRSLNACLYVQPSSQTSTITHLDHQNNFPGLK